MSDAATRVMSLSVPVLVVLSVVLVSLIAWLVRPLQRAFILNPYLAVRRGQLHRLLTAGWVHTDITHLAFNMFSLWFFAEQAAKTLGPTLFVALYVSAVPVAFVPTTLRHLSHPNYNTLGASGAVAAIMISAILLNPKLRLYLMFIPIPVPAMLFAALYLAYSAWHSLAGGNDINHDAHFSGAIYGGLFTFAFEPARVTSALRSLF